MNLYIRIVADKYSLIKEMLSSVLSEKDDLISQKQLIFGKTWFSVPGEQWVNSIGTGMEWLAMLCPDADILDIQGEIRHLDIDWAIRKRS